MTLVGHLRYWESFSRSLIHVMAESLISIANSLEPDDDRSNARSSEAIDPSMSVWNMGEKLLISQLNITNININTSIK